MRWIFGAEVLVRTYDLSAQTAFRLAMGYQHILRGTLIDDQFQLERQLGAGGMGTVWVAQDLRLGRSVAIKFLAADALYDAHAHMRFEREARMVGKIRSPHVVQVFAQGLTPQGVPYVVMELLEGEDLQARIERAGPCNLSEAGSIVDQVCRALMRAHRDGLVHRDIKPHNIFLTPETGGHVFVKLLDFGIAKDISQRLTTLTATGAVMGSLFYVSPEQLREPQAVGPATDVWSLGVVIYQMLTAQLPFDGASLPELFLRIAEARFTPASEVNRGLPRDVDVFLSRALMPDRSLRFASVEELGQAFMQIARVHSSGVIIRPSPTPQPSAAASGALVSAGPPRSRRLVLWLALAIVFAVFAVVAVSMDVGREVTNTPSLKPAPPALQTPSAAVETTNAVAPPPPAAGGPVQAARPAPAIADTDDLPKNTSDVVHASAPRKPAKSREPIAPSAPPPTTHANQANTDSAKYGF